MLSKELSVIDAHTHATGVDILNYFTPRIPSVQSLRELKGKLDGYGVSRAVVFPFPGTFYYNPHRILKENVWEPSDLEDFPYQQENQVLLAEIRIQGWQNSFFPFLAFDPIEKTDAQCYFLAQEDGYYGIKVHTLATRSSPLDVKGDVIKILEKRDIPIFFYTGPQKNTSAEHVLEFARENPQIRVGLAHLADFDEKVLAASVKLSNLFIDTSPFISLCYFAKNNLTEYLPNNKKDWPYSEPEKVLQKLFSLVGDRLIWGTDEPFTTFSNRKGKIVTNFTYGDEVELLTHLIENGFSEMVRRITNENIRKFLLGGG